MASYAEATRHPWLQNTVPRKRALPKPIPQEAGNGDWRKIVLGNTKENDGKSRKKMDHPLNLSYTEICLFLFLKLP